MTGRVAVTKMGLNDMFVVVWAITSGNTNLALAVLWLSLGVFGSIRFTLKHWHSTRLIQTLQTLSTCMFWYHQKTH